MIEISNTTLWFIPSFLRKKIEKNEEWIKIFTNINWLTLEKMGVLALGFLISVWTTRYLGPEGIGYINFAAAFVSLFAFFSTLGLDNITIRNIVNNPELKNEYLGITFC